MAQATLHVSGWANGGDLSLVYDDVTGVVSAVQYNNPDPYTVYVDVVDSQTQQTATVSLTANTSGSRPVPAGALTLVQITNKLGKTVWAIPSRYSVEVHN